MKQSVLLLFLLLSSRGATGQQLTRLTDINKTTIYNGNSYPRSFCAFNGKLFFLAYNANQVHPWYTDGTPGGTQLLKAVNVFDGNSGIDNFLVAGSYLFFLASDSVHGRELWASDGTPAGTTMVKDILHGPASAADNFQAAVLNDRLIFAASDSVHGTELWTSDGTNAGTYLLKDIFPGLSGSGPLGFFRLNDKVLFTVTGDGLHNISFWVTDGTDTGTHFVREIGAAHTCRYGDRIVFQANDVPPPSNNFEPWISDGTPAGTHIIKELVPNGSSMPANFVSYAGKVFFSALDTPVYYPYTYAYFVTDGTDTGTHKTGFPVLSGAVPMNGTWYGSAGNTQNYELWSSDGTATGTRLIKDIYPGNTGSSPTGMAVLNNRLYFAAVSNNNDGRVLWQSDGTDTGTRVVIPSTWANANALADLWRNTNELIPFNGALYYSGHYDSTGMELWRLDPDRPLAIPPEVKPQQVLMYPNPALDKVIIRGIRVREAVISDMTGNRVGDATGNELRTGQLPPGMYFVRIVDEHGRIHVARFSRL